MDKPIWRPLSGPLIFSDAGPLTLSPERTGLVDEIWSQAVARNPRLFDGRCLIVTSVEENRLIVAQARYRHVLALRHERGSIGEGRPLALAVSGILSCADGLVFGRRAAVTGEPGRWELVPSGGAESLDLEGQILRELWEEIGLRPQEVTVGTPIGLVEDEGLLDVVIPLVTPLGAGALIESHAERGSAEYDRLGISCAPSGFIAACESVVVATAAVIAAVGGDYSTPAVRLG